MDITIADLTTRLEQSIPEDMDVSDNLSSFIIDLPDYFNRLGYQVPFDFPERFFTFIQKAKPNKSFNTFEDYQGIIASMVAKTPEAFRKFPTDYKRYIKNRHMLIVPAQDADSFRKSQEQKQSAQSTLASAKADIAKNNETLAHLKERLAALEKGLHVISESKSDEIAEKITQVQDTFDGIFSDAPDVRSLHLAAAGKLGKEAFTALNTTKLQEELKEGLIKSSTSDHFSEMLSIIQDETDILDKLTTNGSAALQQFIKQTEQALLRAEQEAAKTQEQLDTLLQSEKQELTTLIQKGASVQHREVFDHATAHNAIQSSGSGITEELLTKSFDKLTRKEQRKISDYITDNARKFRTRFSRNIKTAAHHRLDMAETIKKACATGGVPLRLSYIKPKRSKTRLVMLLDISGSCREASNLMLTFMHAMREVFPGGCKLYVFVNKLYDISDFMDTKNASESIDRIFNTIPTRGVYSDYYTPLKMFYADHMAELTKDTLVFWIGDARNNRNASGVELFKAMARKSKKTFWINTDLYEKWNKGDSIIGAYEPYINYLSQAVNTEELLNFLMSIH